MFFKRIRRMISKRSAKSESPVAKDEATSLEAIKSTNEVSTNEANHEASKVNNASKKKAKGKKATRSRSNLLSCFGCRSRKLPECYAKSNIIDAQDVKETKKKLENSSIEVNKSCIEILGASSSLLDDENDSNNERLHEEVIYD